VFVVGQVPTRTWGARCVPEADAKTPPTRGTGRFKPTDVTVLRCLPNETRLCATWLANRLPGGAAFTDGARVTRVLRS